MGAGCRLLYFVKSKTKRQAVLCAFMSIHSFAFLEMAERGAIAPPSHPPKSTTTCININRGGDYRIYHGLRYM